MRTFDSDVDSIIASLEAQIMELETTEARLLQQLEICQESLRQAHASLAHVRNQKMPVSRLSDNVLALIFEAGPHPDLRFFDYLDKPKKLPFPILVSHVSRTWREVAIRDPFLWTSIYIVSSKPHDLGLMYMNRSKSCSLDIRYICDIEKMLDFDPSILQLQRCRHLITVQFRSIRHPSVTATRLTKFSFRRPTLEAVTGSGFRQLWPYIWIFWCCFGPVWHEIYSGVCRWSQN